MSKKNQNGNAIGPNKYISRLMIGVVMMLVMIGQTPVVSMAYAAPIAGQTGVTGYMTEADAGAVRKHIAMVETQGVDTVLDIPLRLGGLVVTLVGTGLFIGTSPITGLMTALYPHNAIEKAADFLVVRPGRYTFVRPSGDFYYDARSSSEK